MRAPAPRSRRAGRPVRATGRALHALATLSLVLGFLAPFLTPGRVAAAPVEGAPPAFPAPIAAAVTGGIEAPLADDDGDGFWTGLAQVAPGI